MMESEDSYELGDTIIVDLQEALEVGEYDLGEMVSICCYQLTNLYQQNCGIRKRLNSHMNKR